MIKFLSEPLALPILMVATIIMACMVGEMKGWIVLHFAERKRRRHRRHGNTYIVLVENGQHIS